MSIKHAILGLLSWKPATGYELKKIIEESSSMYWSGNNNQIYKALLQLQDGGFVTHETEHQEGLPSKKVYTITDEGSSELRDWVLSSPDAPEFRKPFLVQLAWSDLLQNHELSDILTKYENEIKMQLILHQERTRRGSALRARTEREKVLWTMIDENILSSYRNELDWVRRVSSQLFADQLVKEETKMDYTVVEMPGWRYIELVSGSAPISSEQDALDLVALCGEYETSLLMLHSQAVSEDFYRLRTGVAGKVLQKFVNYHIKAAILIADEHTLIGKFKDMVAEANRGDQFRIFSDKADAEEWLSHL